MKETPRTSFDALIVGAGPAGSAVAIELARAGWSVALVERQAFPRHMVCGECIAASNLPLLQALGIGDAFETQAGPALRQVTLLHGERSVTADLPAAADDRFPWGRSVGRDALDSMLLEGARNAGAVVFQPWSVQAILGTRGAWHCELRALDSSALRRLRTTLVIDAHGSWVDLPADRPPRELARGAADLFAFKANFTRSSLPANAISLLALDGGYGSMVLADGGITTVACCIRRDRLSELRGGTPGQRAGDVVEAWLRHACTGVRLALHDALREGPWLTAGPLDPGVRIDADDEIFSVGNAAGEAHPILGEGLSMALQSAALLCTHLLDRGSSAPVPDGRRQAAMQRRYAAAWRQEFAPRLRLAAAFAQLAMRPGPAAALMTLAQAWPGLLPRGARWSGRVRYPGLPALPQRSAPEPWHAYRAGYQSPPDQAPRG